MTRWRMLKLQTHDAAMNMAIDEAILTNRIESKVPNTIRFYRWNPSAASVGRFQDVQKEVQLESCRKCGVDIVRRITGGGTVYHDSEGEITYSVVASKADLGSSDLARVYARIYSGLVEALRLLGITSDFSEGNQNTCPNLTVRGKKISGSAQAHKSGIVLQHGTLLLSVDLERMFSLLQVPWARTCAEVIGVASSRITSISQELARNVSSNEVGNALVKGFQKILDSRLEEIGLMHYEKEWAERLCKEKYATDEWTLHGRSELS